MVDSVVCVPPVEDFPEDDGEIEDEDEMYHDDGVDAGVDDEEPEDVEAVVAALTGASSQQQNQKIDPNMCGQCRKEPYKYRCPKCNTRTCSLDCSKQHKIDKDCDGVRGAYQVVSGVSQYSANTSVDDQKFLHGLKSVIEKQNETEKALTHAEIRDAYTVALNGGTSSGEMVRADGGPMLIPPAPNQTPGEVPNPEGLRHHWTSAPEKYLIQNAHLRRVWLSYSDNKGGEDNSRHEQFSDTIFWTIDMIFSKKGEGEKRNDYTYRIHNIPETITVKTVLRQFLRPKVYGCVVSQSDLDMDKMQPFIDTGIDKCTVLMRVPSEDMRRFYPVNKETNFLDNTRNRFVVNHLEVVIVLDEESIDMQLLSEDESVRIRDKQRAQIKPPPFRGGMRGGACGTGGFRGRGGRGGGGRGGFDANRMRGGGGGAPMRMDRGGKRFSDGPGRDDNKRGRGGQNNRRGRRYDEPDFDPFEPFEGPCAVPVDSLADKE